MYSFVDNILQNILSSESDSDDEQHFEFRGSALPYCPIKHFLSTVDPQTGGESFFSDFFLEIGTAVHSVVQKWLARVPGLLFGNWMCPACHFFIPWKHGPQYCPKCEEEMVYHELAVKDGEFSGHSDGLLKYLDGYILLEVKTSSLWRLDNLEGPKLEHILQDTSYAVLLSRKHNINIKGIVWLYIARNNPYKYKLFIQHGFQPQLYDNMVIDYKNTCHIIETGEVEKLEKVCAEPCDGEWCDFVNVCFRSNRLSDFKKRWVKWKSTEDGQKKLTA